MMTVVHRRFWLILIAIVAVAFVIRWGYVLEFRRDQASCNLMPPMQICGDAFNYHNGANLLADGKGYIDPLMLQTAGVARATAAHPPLYMTYLAAWSALGARTVLWHQFASVVIGLGAVIAVALAARDLLSQRVALIAAATMAVYPYVWANDATVMSETMAIFTAVLAVWAAARFLRAPTVPAAAVVGVVSSAAMLTRSEFALFLPLIIVAALVSATRLHEVRRRMAHAAVAIIAFAVIAAPWAVRNLAAFHRPVLVTTGLGLAMAYSNCDATYSGSSLGYWSYWCAVDADAAGPGRDESDEEIRYRRHAINYVSDHSGDVPRVVMARFLRQWNLYSPVNQMDLDLIIEGRERTVSRASLAAYYFLLPFSFVGAIVLWRRQRSLLVAAMAVPIVITAAALLTYANTRFRAPAEFVVVLLAAVGAVHVWDRSRTAACTADHIA